MQKSIEKIDVVPDAIYIKFELDETRALISHVWSQTDNEDLQCLVRGMLARLPLDQGDWMELGDTLFDQDGGLANMTPKGTA